MIYRALGKTGLRVSVVGVGTWQYGGEWGKVFTQSEVDAIFGAAGDCGINLIDTAECYGDHLSEQLVGQAIRGKRGQWIIATKFGHQFHSFMNRTDRRGVVDVRKQLDDSLTALQTDYIDLYQYHSIRNEEFDNQDLRDFLDGQVKAGKIRHIGNSVGMDMRHQVERSPWAAVEAIQLVYNRLERKAEEVFPACSAMNLGVLARVPLASGLLSGKYKAGATFAAEDVRSRRKREELDARIAEVEQIARAEVPAGVNMAQWALAWCLRDPVVSSVIPGCKSVEQTRSNAAAADVLAKLWPAAPHL